MSRRDFLKLLGTASLFAPFSRLVHSVDNQKLTWNNSAKPNIIILLFDTFSARHMSLYGYERVTTPNIDKFAEKSTVFHHNYAPSSFTQPSTASILTGVYPWSHRSLTFFSPLLKKFETENIFTGLNSSHQTIAYTHNINAANILEQFKEDIDLLKPIRDLVVYDGNKYQYPFAEDAILGLYAARRWLEANFAPSYSLFLNPIFRLQHENSRVKINNTFINQYPLGISEKDGYLFKLEDAMDWIGQISTSNSQPFFGYFHLLPPHEEYKPRVEFLDMFANDGYSPIEKPEHHFTANVSAEQQKINRQLYDEYIALVDAEFGRLVKLLEDLGVLENTYLILTSDHGQMMERGIHGHLSPVLYEPVIHIPLLIHSPGQETGKNIYSLTSNIDIVPTLLDLMGQNQLADGEGLLLPGFGGIEDQDRVIFSMCTQQSAKLRPLTTVTYSVIQWPYKLIRYSGYQGYNNIDEMYNLENDPNELNNLVGKKHTIANKLKTELLKKKTSAEKNLFD